MAHGLADLVTQTPDTTRNSVKIRRFWHGNAVALRMAMKAVRLLIVLAAIGGSGCALFGLDCSSKSVPMYWSDGTVTPMSMTVCGYRWNVKK